MLNSINLKGNAMNRQSVESSNLSSVGWENGILEVEFKNGSVYKYFDVPQEEYVALMNATSLGKYFNTNIRNNYTSEKL